MSVASLIVVVYNQTVDDVPVIKAALNAFVRPEIIVCDNSTHEYGNRAICETLGVCYVDMAGNKGLPAAYRVGIERCHGDLVCLFDDDTEVDQDYFTALDGLDVSSPDWDVDLPLVMSGDSVLSPCTFDGFRAHSFPDINSVSDCSELSGINSGMIVKRSVFEAVSYDLDLFLDLVDHKFIDDVKKAGMKVVYLRGPLLKQSYSLASDNVDKALKRLAIFERDARHFYDSSTLSRLYCIGMLAVRKAKLCLRYRTTCFLISNKDD